MTNQNQGPQKPDERDASSNEKMERMRDLAQKGWNYLLGTIEQPKNVPAVVKGVIQGVHAGELIKLRRHQAWFDHSGIQTVIDVGAHSGEFASAVREVLPEAHILSFEPQPDCYDELRQKMATRKPFQAFCMALGDQSGEISFYRSRFSKSSSVLKMSERHQTEFPWTAGDLTEIKVKIDTLDNVAKGLDLRQNVMLKLDVQGYELNVLRGAVNTFPQIACLLVETSAVQLYEGEALFDEVAAFLSEHGYIYSGTWEQTYSAKDGRLLQSDSLFVRHRAAE